MADTLVRFDLLSMLVLGLLGTGHCVGMCGPLVVAFPVRIGVFSAQLWYHLGRITTYTLVGVALGALGSTLGRLDVLAHLQVALGAVAAAFLLTFGLARIGLMREPAFLRAQGKVTLTGSGLVRRLLGGRRPASMLPLGLVLGLLPCGLSYAAFARALPAGGPVEGGMMLAAFGLGTLPGLLVVGTAASRLMTRYRALSDVLAGVLMVAMAVDLGADVLQALF
jgi:sulfite exporter TauE/SafE